MATYFKNPVNGYTEKATGGWTWLWALVFGPFYYLYKGAWPHALGYFGLLFLLGSAPRSYRYGYSFELVLWLIIGIIFAVVAYPVVRKTYRRAGWFETSPEHENRQRGSRQPPPLATPAIWTHDDRRNV